MRNIRTKLTVVSVILLGSLGTATSALGQRKLDGNVLPAPFSPYMQLFRDDTQAMPAYYQYLRPEVERRELLDRVETRIRALEGPTDGRQTLRLPAGAETGADTTRSLRLRAPATTTTPRKSAVRMDLMHFYPGATSTRGIR